MHRLTLLLAVLLAPGAFAQGVIQFGTPTYDFGSIDEGVQAEHTFAFTNTGDAPLTVADVQTSCGCTAPSYTSEPVAPGEAGEVTVVFDSDGRPGPFQKRITVRTTEEAVGLQITGTVVPDFVGTGVAQGHFLFDAAEAEAAPLTLGEPLQHAFRFQNTGDRPLRILGVTVPPGVEARTPNTIVFPGGVGTVALVVEYPDAFADADGRIELPVSVETNDETQPVKALRVLATVAAEASGTD